MLINSITEIKRGGLKPTTSDIYPIVMPSEADTNTTLNSSHSICKSIEQRLKSAQEELDSTRGEIEQNRVNAIKDGLKSRNDIVNKIRNCDRDVGSLWACSGLQESLDWSLILAPKRVIENEIPDAEVDQLRHVAYVPSGIKIQTYSMENVKAEEMVIKRRRTTGVTVGTMNAIQTTVIECFKTKEENKKVKYTTWLIAPR